jgi:hypothetical protein
MKILCVVLLGLLVGALGSCGKGGGGEMDAFMKLDTEKAAAFSVGGDDCEAKAKSVAEWRSKNNAKYKEMRQNLNAKYPKGPPEDLMKKYGEQMEKNKKAVIDAMMKCTNTPAFDNAIDSTK